MRNSPILPWFFVVSLFAAGASGQDPAPPEEESRRVNAVRELDGRLRSSPQRESDVQDLGLLWVELLRQYEEGERSRDLSTAVARAAHAIRTRGLQGSWFSDPYEKYYRQALRIAQTIGDEPAEARVAYDLGRYLLDASRTFEAYELFKRGADLRTRSRPYLLRYLIAIARTDRRWDEARDWLAQAAASIESEDTRVSLRFDLLGERFLYHLGLGLLDVAAVDLAELAPLVEVHPRPAGARELYLSHQLDFCLATDELVRAVDLADELLESSEDEALRSLARFLRALALVELSRRSPAERPEAIAALEEVCASEGLPQQDRLRAALFVAMLQLEGDDHAAAGERIAAVGAEIEILGRAHEQDVRLRLRVFHDLLDGYHRIIDGAPEEERRRALDRMRDAFDRFLDEWRSIPPRPGGIGFLWYSHKQLFLEYLMRATLLVEGGELGAAQALEAFLRAQAQASLTRRLGVPESVTLEMVRESLLPPEHGLLVYLPSPERGLVFAVDGERIVVADLPPRQVLLGARRGFLDDVTRRPARGTESARPSESATSLAAELLPPSIAERVRGWSAITVTGLDLLGWIPFACLPFPEDRPIGLEWAVDVLPSVSLGIHLAELERVSRPASEVLFLGAPTPSFATEQRYRLEELNARFDADDRERMQRSVGGRPLRIHTGKDATAELLASESLREVALLHFLIHGIFDPRGERAHAVRERPAGLVLAPSSAEDDGLLWCEDVESLEHVPPLVVLSACGAAREQVRQGDGGVDHLGGAFLAAGARTVLLSRANLDYDATLELTTRFTKHLLSEGAPPARALMMARRELVAEHPEWAHPYYHGLLEVVGLGQVPLRLADAPPAREGGGGWRLAISIVGVGLGALVLGAWLGRKCRRNRVAG